MYVWFLQVECFYVVRETRQPTGQNCYGEIVIASFIIGIWLLERNLNMLGLAN